jgi:exoribonuclease II
MAVAADGSVHESDVYRALVRNQAKLAYRGVAAWLDGTDKMPEAMAKVKGMDEQLRLQDCIAQAMKAARHEHGALELESIEPQAVMSDGKVVALRLEKKNRAQDLIEDFMIAANGVTAQFLMKHGIPALSRVVRSPERWDRIRKVAEDLGDKLPAVADSKVLAAFLSKRRRADPLRFPDLSLTIVKLMGPGEYVLQLPNQPTPGHFGLAVATYNHSTAPNRRYPDLITQRLLKAVLAGIQPPYTAQELEWLAAHCTEQEDAARKVERQVRKSAAALLLTSHIGQTYDALITGVADKGTWVRLLNPPVEGKLVRGQERVAVGDRIRVQLVSLDVARGFIDFVRAGP